MGEESEKNHTITLRPIDRVFISNPYMFSAAVAYERPPLNVIDRIKTAIKRLLKR